MKTILFTGAAAFAAAATAQVPPTTGSTNSMTQPATPSTMPADSSPMSDDMDSMDRTTMDRTTTTVPANSATMPSNRSPAMTPNRSAARPMPADNMGTPRSAPQPNAVNNPQRGRNMGATQPTPMAAPASVGPGQYQVCTQQVTDRCINPNDIRRGIAKRPARR